MSAFFHQILSAEPSFTEYLYKSAGVLTSRNENSHAHWFAKLQNTLTMFKSLTATAAIAVCFLSILFTLCAVLFSLMLIRKVRTHSAFFIQGAKGPVVYQ